MSKTKSDSKRPIEQHIRYSILDRDNYTCIYCGKEVKEFQIDHIYPYVLGGSNDIDNLVTSCVTCNNKKSSTIIENIDEILSIVSERNKNYSFKYNKIKRYDKNTAALSKKGWLRAKEYIFDLKRDRDKIIEYIIKGLSKKDINLLIYLYKNGEITKFENNETLTINKKNSEMKEILGTNINMLLKSITKQFNLINDDTKYKITPKVIYENKYVSNAFKFELDILEIDFLEETIEIGMTLPESTMYKELVYDVIRELIKRTNPNNNKKELKTKRIKNQSQAGIFLYKEEMDTILSLETSALRRTLYCILLASKRFSDEKGEFYCSYKKLSEFGTCKSIQHNKKSLDKLHELEYIKILNGNEINLTATLNLKENIEAEKVVKTISRTKRYKVLLKEPESKGQKIRINPMEIPKLYESVSKLYTIEESKSMFQKNIFYNEFRPFYMNKNKL